MADDLGVLPLDTRAHLDDDTLRSVLSTLPDPILVVDAEAALLWGNHAAEVFFGRCMAESIGISGLELVHPDDLDFVLLSLMTVQGKEAGAPIEIRLMVPSGWRLVELIGAPLPGPPDGRIVLSIRDLTARRSFEVATDDVAKFRSLVQNAAALTMLVSPEGNVESASGALARSLAHDHDLVVGRPLAELVTDDDRLALAHALDAAVAGRPGLAAAQTVEVELRRGDSGDPVPFELTIVNLVDDPTVGGLVVSGHDVSQRKEVEAKLHTTLSLLSATLDSTNDGILVVDRAGAITSFNRRFVEMWQIPESITAAGDDAAAIEFVLAQIVNPDLFVAKVNELYADPEAESNDILEFLDGHVFERYSMPQRVDGLIVGRVWSFRDVTERKRLEDELAHQALHDSLTQLANQSLFRDRVEHALARMRRGGSLAVLFLDLDNFKTVNDSLGHPIGDELLVGVSERLERCLRATDTAARLGGDEFAILLEDAGSEADVIDVAERLLRSLNEPFTLGSTELAASASIGVAFAKPGTSCDQLLRNADLAMYTAKRRGKGRCEVFQAAMHTVAVERLKVEAELRRGIVQEELTLQYQPMVELSSGAIVAVEALVRWNHPTRGLLGPAAFIEMAEESSLIEELGQIVLTEACWQLAQWRAEHPSAAHVAVSVNLAPRQLVHPDLLPRVRAALEMSGLEPSALILEITEGAMMRDTALASAHLASLRELGVRIAVDDFGTGYSSLAYLQRFPIDIIKIDKSFIDRIDGDGADVALPHAIIRLAQTLELIPVAEGVERLSQLTRLRELGCELAQGYYFARPMEPDAVAALLDAKL